MQTKGGGGVEFEEFLAKRLNSKECLAKRLYVQYSEGCVDKRLYYDESVAKRLKT